MICKIYILKNIVNNKIYIGQTWQSYKERFKKGEGYKGSDLIYDAIKEFGYNSFIYETLAECSTQEEADRLEYEYILNYKALDPKFGYNNKEGGCGSRLTESAKNKLSASIIGHEVSMETRLKISNSLLGNIPWNKGKTGIYSKETRKKISDSLKGQFISDETRQKLSLALSGEKHPMYGKKHTEESKAKMSATKTGVIGEDAYRALFTMSQAKEIRKKYSLGISRKQLAKEYECSRNTIDKIINNLTYKE